MTCTAASSALAAPPATPTSLAIRLVAPSPDASTSAGVRSGEPVDPFMVAALDEIGIDARKHRPRTIEELDEWEGLNFDLIVTLAPEAHHKALELTHTIAADVEYWPTPDPTDTEGSREQRLQAYRDVCDGLLLRIRRRFGGTGHGQA